MDGIIEGNRVLYVEIKGELEELNVLLDYEDKEEPEYKMKKNIFVSLNHQLATVIAEEKQEVEAFRSSVR